MFDKRGSETLNSIEETQHALRQSISQTRQLAAEADRLIRRYRGEGEGFESGVAMESSPPCTQGGAGGG